MFSFFLENQIAYPLIFVQFTILIKKACINMVCEFGLQASAHAMLSRTFSKTVKYTIRWISRVGLTERILINTIQTQGTEVSAFKLDCLYYTIKFHTVGIQLKLCLFAQNFTQNIKMYL